jgi:MFS family permease
VIAGLLLLGPLSDSVGRRAPLVATLFLAAGASVLFALAQTTAVLFAARALQGLAVGIASGAAMTVWRPRRPALPPAARPFVAATLAATAGWAMAGLFLAVIPSYAALLLGSDDLALLGGIVFVMLAASCAARAAARATPAHSAMLVVALVAGAALVALAFPTRSLAVLMAGALLAGLGQGLTWLGATTTINAIAPHDRRAEVSSTYFAAIYLGVSLAVVGVGALATAISLEVAVYVFAAVVSAGALATVPIVARPAELTTV